MANPGGRRSNAYQIAVGGILSAFALVVLLAGGLIPIGELAAPIFAGLFLLPVALDIGVKWAFLCYVAVGALGFMLVPNVELVLFFVLLFGYYPILRPALQRIKNRVLRWVVKLGIFNLAVAAVYVLLLFLFTSSGVRQELAEYAPWFMAVLLAMANATFVLYDIMMGYLLIVYNARVRKHIFKK